MSLAVAMRDITVRFGDVTALDRVSLEVEQGTLHAIVGENGAGKTTLMRVLYGAQPPTEGTFDVHGTERRFRSSAQAIAAGVGMVSQHYGILPELNCLENLMLGAEPGVLLKPRQAQHRAEALAERMGFHFDWRADAATLSPAGAQKLEILKLLWRDARVMILDEPTAMLSPADADALFASLRKLTAEGATVLLVTHRLPEVMDFAKRVTVLRGGNRVADLAVSETTSSELAGLIVGRSLAPAAAHAAPTHAEPVLVAKNLTVRGRRGDDALKDVSLELRRGEVLGVAGVDGSGQRELVGAILGLLTPRSGTLTLDGEDFSRLGVAARIAAGVRAIPEDRHAEAVIEDWSLEDNAALGLQRLAPYARGAALDRGSVAEAAGRMATRFNTKHGGLWLAMRTLSGGNQQRFVAGRALDGPCRVLLAFQPARGLDILATREVYAGIREACDAGATALVVSFDLDELLEHTDRVVAMNGGRLYEPEAAQAKDRDAIGRLMVGAT